MLAETLPRLAAFMAERHAVYMRKAYLEDDLERQEKGLKQAGMSYRMALAWKGRQQSWTLDNLTDDPILARYRFCNVYRELDRVTVWIRENIREPFADHEHLWFMLAVARHINWPDTLAELIKGHEPIPVAPLFQVSPEMVEFYPSWPHRRGFEPRHMTSVLQRRQARGDKVYTGAYMIRAEQHDRPWRHWPKVRYSAEVVLGKLWECREDFRQMLELPNNLGPQPDLTVESAWKWFQHSHYTGWGPFMAYQVVVDMRHTRYLRGAPDINTWSAIGPGSTRGLNRLHSRPLTTPVKQEAGLDEMREVRRWLGRAGVLAPWLDLPELSDVQNCLCEFDKYERVRLSEGRPRALYIPGRGS